MLSRIGPFYTQANRKAEGSDTRQNILRHDKDQPQGKKNKPDKDEQDENDLAEASIDSMILFLQSALPAAEPPEPDKATPIPPPEQSQNARAASAYAQAGGQPKSPPPRRQDQAPSTAPALSQQDIDSLNALITDLENLKIAGYTALPIREGQNFLDSLIKAIRVAQKTIKS